MDNKKPKGSFAKLMSSPPPFAQPKTPQKQSPLQTQEVNSSDNKTELTNSDSTHLSQPDNTQKELQVSNNDAITSSRHGTNLRKWRDIIEDTEVQNSALRVTKEERYAIEDLVSELRRKYKIKTSMNEIARLGLLYIIDDFKKEKQQALIIKVKRS
jgi:hypothetical protein